MKSTGLGGRSITGYEALPLKHDLPYLKYRHLSETYVIKNLSQPPAFRRNCVASGLRDHLCP
ncbi:hypothetical protein CUJ84_Chr002657 [Rhizobium leguminosarum]|uniref:Uncharacterized protein n=1 Tax=Rhizobium leguminosarum TaxID=384 RepID=A0A2K9Z498_RHILE|nr:hypothetical protein CUJ84_Chr002657 [Rhizobium leguminosarum]